MDCPLEIMWVRWSAFQLSGVERGSYSSSFHSAPERQISHMEWQSWTDKLLNYIIKNCRHVHLHLYSQFVISQRYFYHCYSAVSKIPRSSEFNQVSLFLNCLYQDLWDVVHCDEPTAARMHHISFFPPTSVCLKNPMGICLRGFIFIPASSCPPQYLE